jgi:phosphoglycolate phosphatase-like HAD superfamily hydrolase
LILWDIDGTLVRAGDIGAAVFDTALATVLGSRPPDRVRMSGKTDPQIVLEYFEMMDVEATDGLVDAVLERIAVDLAEAAADGVLVADGHACPGVPYLLETLAADDRVVSTLLTGNIYPNAIVKVAAFGLDKWLDPEIGAYGSDHLDRNRLVPIALAKVAAARPDGTRTLTAGDAWVVGDTPRDLECARVAGARCLLVGTGRYSTDELASLGADAVLPDLSDTGRVLDLLTGDL